MIFAKLFSVNNNTEQVLVTLELHEVPPAVIIRTTVDGNGIDLISKFMYAEGAKKRFENFDQAEAERQYKVAANQVNMTGVGVYEEYDSCPKCKNGLIEDPITGGKFECDICEGSGMVKTI